MAYQSSLAQGTDPLFPVRQFWDQGFRGKPAMEGYYQPPSQTEAQARAALSLAPTVNQQAYQNQIANRGLDIQSRQVGVQERALDKAIQMNRTGLPFAILQQLSGLTANNALPNLVNSLTGLPTSIANAFRSALPASWFTQGTTPTENQNMFGGLGDTTADIDAGGIAEGMGGGMDWNTLIGDTGGLNFLDYLGSGGWEDFSNIPLEGWGGDAASGAVNWGDLADPAGTFSDLYAIDWANDFGIDFNSVFGDMNWFDPLMLGDMNALF